MEIPTSGIQAMVACNKAKGVCLIIIAVVVWALFEIQKMGVEGEGVWFGMCR